jgi:hypothetical protein
VPTGTVLSHTQSDVVLISPKRGLDNRRKPQWTISVSQRMRLGLDSPSAGDRAPMRSHALRQITLISFGFLAPRASSPAELEL